MSDSKGNYSRIPAADLDHDINQPTMLTQGFQPPPYTPSSTASSPHLPAASASNLYPQLHPHSLDEPKSLYPQPFDTTKPPPPMPHYQHFQQQQQPQQQPQQQLQVQGPHCMSSPLILMSPPTRVEELKSKPGVVVCQHCHYLVLTETTPENGSCTYLGVLGLLMAGVTSCGCCLLPLFLTSCKDMMHSCPSCHEDIGLYSRIKEKTFPVKPNGHHH
ncbi:hypothetical protein BGW38_009595 [Lunasporangiospora selenospora]|uniref:LITAF domain-containing protein n=1 Tax=Lunasporangiospora selenospora TaxID=979761 RepID=A0A9P6FX68_9FUNG|nr:hypothetical protein BGW38_009595 [Lunasporangiospora selenospora]